MTVFNAAPNRHRGMGAGGLTGSSRGAYACGMGEDKLGPQRPPSPRELATAYGILQGQSTAAAMRAAGYSANTADVKAGKVEARLRALGLLPTPEDARDLVATMRRVIVEEDGGEGLRVMFRTMLARAQAGDIASMRIIMEYLVGKPTQIVQAAVATQTKVVFEYSDDIIVKWPGDEERAAAERPAVILDLGEGGLKTTYGAPPGGPAPG